MSKVSKAPDLPSFPETIVAPFSDVVFVVGDRVRIMADDKPQGTVTAVKATSPKKPSYGMAVVALDSPAGAERYVPFQFLEKL